LKYLVNMVNYHDKNTVNLPVLVSHDIFTTYCLYVLFRKKS